jgi:RHH-type proline utilization regulon transcriptional repressor/proline dehydrogenase/delta 1-pyrroline-5-carboxylate dehydrogenase
VLHVLRYRREQLGELIEQINATGYGLTFGVHSRIDETIDFVTARVRAGNLYVNRNMIGAVVGVQPFGGRGLSGTGPKAGGPLMLPRLRRGSTWQPIGAAEDAAVPPVLGALRRWAEATGRAALAADCETLARATPLARSIELPGPTGETNRLRFMPRGTALCAAEDADELLRQAACALATGNRVLLSSACAPELLAMLPPEAGLLVSAAPEPALARCDVALCLPAQAPALRRTLAARDGPRVRVLTPLADSGLYPLEALACEQTLTVNTAAAGGNASLMTLEST